MLTDDSNSEKKRQNNLFSFLSNGKHHLLSSMGYNAASKKGTLITKGIFGAPLKSASMCSSCNESGLFVPDPVYRCFEEIIKRGLLTEGIFRLSGAAPEVEQLQQDFDKPPTYGRYLDLSQSDIHAITGTVKKFLRQLPDPAIPTISHEKFIQLFDNSPKGDFDITTLASMVQQLPREHFHLIYYIISLSSRIQKHADTNMMNPEALAIVLAPVCTGLENNLKDIPSWVKRNPRGSNTSRMIYDMNHLIEANTKWTGIWTRMIEHSEQLLGCWKDSLWQGGVYNTVPCHPSYSASGVLSNPSRHSTSLSRLHHGSELFDIVPPLCGNTNYYTTHYEGNDQKANVAELYRVVALRSNSSKRHYRQRSDSKSHIDCPRASNSTSTMGMSTQSSIYPSSILTTASSNITSCMD